jgi:hypothetical protein
MMIQNQTNRDELIFSERVIVEEEIQAQLERGRSFRFNRICPHCGEQELVPAGSCHICRNCGVSIGCS